jgi:hypothetical protein
MNAVQTAEAISFPSSEVTRTSKTSKDRDLLTVFAVAVSLPSAGLWNFTSVLNPVPSA